jgi:flagellin
MNRDDPAPGMMTGRYQKRTQRMSLSIQTNIASLDAINSTRINTNFQNDTIAQLSSGYRINSSGDDAAGLAVANQYAGSIAVLNQGVLNANNGISSLQIVDGGLSNISTIINRLQTLATESASNTFTGDRSTLNTEYQGLLQEIDRQAANVNLNTGGSANTNNITYVGGANTATNAQVSVDLSGTANAVDSKALGIANTNVAGGGTELSVSPGVLNTAALGDTSVLFLAGTNTQVFTFQVGEASGNVQVQATVAGGANGLTGAAVIDSLNSQLAATGITAGIANDGTLEFGGSTAFTVTAAAASGGNVVAQASTAVNTADYNLDSSTGTGGAFAAFTGTTGPGGTSPVETVQFQNANGISTATLSAANAGTLALALTALNTQLSGTGIYAVQTAGATNNISFQSANSFTVDETAFTAQTGGTGNLFGAAGPVTVTAPSSAATSTGAALAALSSLSQAITNLGLVQGTVGAGENKLNYAVNLAQSQITNYSAAESSIRDANIAQEAANLTKAQVLQQASLAALAQANSAPQALLALLKA